MRQVVCLVLLAVVVVEATAVVRVAVVISAAANGSLNPKTVNQSATYFCTGGHAFASAICPYQIRMSARGGFTVGAVSGVSQEFVVFDIGRNTSAKATATTLATRIPRGDYGNFSAAIVTTSRTLGDARMWAAANAAEGYRTGLGNSTGPIALLNIGIADPTQFTNPVTGTQWEPQSFGALVRNDFGLAVSKLAQALYAKEKITTGVPLTFTILSGPTDSGLAVATDIYNSVIASESGLVWFGSNYVWPARASSSEPQEDWDSRIIPWAQGIAALQTKPDVVFVGGLTTEVNVSSTLMYAWKSAQKPWRAKLTCFAGGAKPDFITDDFVDAVFAVQWNQELRGKERDVKDVEGAAEPWPSDPILGIQSPVVFTNDIRATTAVSAAIKLSPVAPAIGSVPVLSIQKAMQLECRGISRIEECDGRKIAAGLSRINAPSPFGPLTYANGQIATSTFFVSQVSDDLTLTFLTSESSNGTLRWSRSWEQLGVPLGIELDGFRAAFSAAVCFIAGTGATIQLGWVLLAKKQTTRTKLRDAPTLVLATSFTLAGVLFCGQWLFAYSVSMTNLPSDQLITGFKSAWVGLNAIACSVGALATVTLIYRLTSQHDAQISDEYAATGHSSSRTSISKSESSPSSVSSTAALTVLDAKSMCKSRFGLRVAKMMLATVPIACAITLGSIFCVLSMDIDGIAYINSSGVTGAFLIAWMFCAVTPLWLFHIRSLVRAIAGGVSLAIAVWLAVVVTFTTTSWKRNITLRASLAPSSLSPNTLFGVSIMLFSVIMFIVQFVSSRWFKGDVTQLTGLVQAAEDRAMTYYQSELDVRRDNMATVLRSIVNFDGKVPEYAGVFDAHLVKEEHRKKTTAATQLTLEKVVSCQPALSFLIESATRSYDRPLVEFLLLVSVLQTYFNMEGPNREKGHRGLIPETIALIQTMRGRLFVTADLNLSNDLIDATKAATAAVVPEVKHGVATLIAADGSVKPVDSTSIGTYDAMVTALQEVLTTVTPIVMNLVRRNNFDRLMPWHLNHLAVLTRRSQMPAQVAVPSVITHTVGTKTRIPMRKVMHSVDITPDRSHAPVAAFESDQKHHHVAIDVDLLPGAVSPQQPQPREIYLAQSTHPSASASEDTPAAAPAATAAVAVISTSTPATAAPATSH